MIAAVFFLAAVHGFFTVYNDYCQATERVERLERRFRILKIRTGEITRNRLVLDKTAQFYQKASQLWLVPEKWHVYTVNFDTDASYQDLERILAQCTNTDAFYFNPQSLSVTAPEPPKQPSGTTSGGKPDESVKVRLSGRFIARKQ